MSSHMDRVIVLVDMDCFYCQVEEKLNPNITGKPIAVVQYNAWRGGGIIAVNYPARDRGVTRHMRGNEAKEKCPEIELVRVPNVRGKADLSKYREAGKRVAEVLQTFTKLLQRASVDEAYLDITEAVNKRISTMQNKLTIEQLPNTHVVGSKTNDFVYGVYNDMENESNLKLAVGGAIVEEIRATVYEKTGYRCSAGIAHNKILAKLVCGLHKPNKQTILPQEGVEELYTTLPIKKIKSLGGKFGVSLSEDLNITYMGELIKFTERELQKKFDDKTASWLYNIARGIDKEPVQAQLVSKSIGCCKKFPGRTALTKPEDVTHWISELAMEISERLELDFEENNRRAKSITISFAQPVNRRDVHSSKVHPLNGCDAKKIAGDTFEVLKKMAQKSDGTFKLTFLGLNVGKFEDCKNQNDISTFFKPTNKENLSVQTQDNTKKLALTTQNNLERKPKNNITSFFKSTLNKIENSVNKIRENKENIDNKNNTELNLEEIELDAEHSLDIDLNKTFQEIQNIKCSNEDIGSFSDATVEEDYSEELKNKQEFPNIAEPQSDTSKSFFMNYVKFLDTSKSPTAIEEEISNITEEIDVPPTEFTFDQPSCSYPTANNSGPIIYNENSNNSSIVDDIEKVCPECSQKVHKYDYVSHMDRHMAEKLMTEERELFQIEFKAKKESLNNARTPKTTNPSKNKSFKRKIAVENNSITPFLTITKEVDENETQQCPECDKRILLSEYACHLDFHAAKKLHLELNPVKYGGITENNNNQSSNKKCKNTNGMISISSFFKTVQN